ncbi:hypothetical protein BZA77DRAFT_301743 [Pyronema omphalodes]|nr:hypothetical protein BZA77DRAFT_301743 [Pyronema omphalodes]
MRRARSPSFSMNTLLHLHLSIAFPFYRQKTKYLYRRAMVMARTGIGLVVGSWWLVIGSVYFFDYQYSALFCMIICMSGLLRLGY